MTKQKQTWRCGDTGYEVEWCKDMPCYPDDPTTCDPDDATWVTKDFRTEAEARAYAVAAYPRCVTGSVSITPFVLEKLCEEDPFQIPYNCHKEYTADSDYYEGE
jgi:hypothetical protein